MRIDLMHKLLDTSGFLYEEFFNEFDDSKDMGREFFKFMKSKFMTDVTQKIRVSDFIKDKILTLDAESFDKKYNTHLVNIKKSKQQLNFCVAVCTQMLKYSSKNDIIDW